jgi:polyisoprenoid-binding protein YceI
MSTAVLTAPALRTYQIDPAHSEVTFQVRHLLSRVRGRFREFSGTIGWNPDQPDDSTVTFTIQTASIDTSQSDRDAHLRSDDFFAADRFPVITFQSEHVTAGVAGTFDVAGTLTIRGVARPIVLPVTYLGSAKDPWGKEKAAFETELTINRREFGLNWNAVLETGGFLVGDEVRVTIAVQAAVEEGPAGSRGRGGRGRWTDPAIVGAIRPVLVP